MPKQLTKKQTDKEPKKKIEVKTPNYNEKDRLAYFYSKLEQKGADKKYYSKVVELVVFFEKKLEEFKYLDSIGEDVLNKMVIAGSNYVAVLQKLDKIIEQDKKTQKQESKEVDYNDLLK